MARKTIMRNSDPLYPEHPLSEHRWRLERMRRIMRQDAIDVLLLARNVNVFYATGSRFVMVGKDAPIAIAPQSTAIITHDADVYCQRFGPFDTDDVALHTSVSESIECYDDELELVGILRDHGVKSGDRVGTEWGPGVCVGINPLKFAELKRRLTEELRVEVVDATTTICKVLLVKSELEIARTKVAVTATARAMDRLLDTVDLSMTERDVARLASRMMLEEGGDAIAHSQVTADGDGSVRFVSALPIDRPLTPGWLHVDMGCKFRGYGADINRGIFLGRDPTDDEQRLYAVRVGLSAVMDRTIKPGISVDALLDAMKDYVEGQGCVLHEMGGGPFGGHGIGLEPYQPPSLLPSRCQPGFAAGDAGDEIVFEPGMMFTYEPAVSLPGRGDLFFNIEDDVVVTETGVENMNVELSRDIRVRL